MLSRLAAYQAPVPRKIYDDLATTGSLIGWRLRHAQRTSIEQLWVRATSEGAAHGGLPASCDRSWFCKTFLGGAGEDRTAADSIWDLVVSFNMCGT